MRRIVRLLFGRPRDLDDRIPEAGYTIRQIHMLAKFYEHCTGYNSAHVEKHNLNGFDYGIIHSPESPPPDPQNDAR